MPALAEILESLKNNDVFFHFKDDQVDWTEESSVNLLIQCNGQKYEIELSNSKEIENLASSLYFYTKDSNLLSWNIKNILSFFRKRSQINVSFSKKVYDLNVICSYFSLPRNKPSTSKEAFFLFNKIKNTESWKSFEKFYDEIYDPLITTVIPSVETNPLVDKEKRKYVYSYYEIEGQSNGRMKTLKIFKNCYLPHSMGSDQKNNLRLPKDDWVFLYYDFKHMEVSVLEWITKDKNLSKILESDSDLYKSIWKNLTGSDATKEQRKICKNIFLPVIFGQGSKSLSDRLKIDEKIASKLIHRLEQSFPVAFSWVKSQDVDSNNYATDIFGRRRKFQNYELYKIRNFCIQSPSNMICLRKLVKLHQSINNKAKIFFHIHDGYSIACSKKDLRSVFEIGKKSLEEEEDLFPGLNLKTSCYFGENLNELKNIKEVIK